MDNSRELMLAAIDVLTGSVPKLDKHAWSMLESIYGEALNGSNCPCGSKGKFQDCCKQEWNLLKRDMGI